MYTLKNFIKENLYQLNENSVLNILNAYKYLVQTTFPVDLLEEIKEMVLMTVKHSCH